MNSSDIDIQDLARALAADFESLKGRHIENNSSMESLLEWSSLNALLITVRIKQNFGVELLPGELRANATFGDLLILIKSKMALN
jgi:acyl carrier protein